MYIRIDSINHPNESVISSMTATKELLYMTKLTDQNERFDNLINDIKKELAL
jgi:hypothetical protein